jgi:glycosyltransferase involved in cell wall biosynthesis
MTIWFISEVYFPDEAGTAYYMTRLAEHFAKNKRVNVLTGMPKYNARGRSVPRIEHLNGVYIFRCLDSTLNKNILLFRLVNVFISSISIFIKAIEKIRKNDSVFVVTSPPLLPFVIGIVCKIHNAKFILRVDDVYPEVFVAAGLFKKGSLLESLLFSANKVLYKKADLIIVLGRDMAELAAKKAGKQAHRIRIIPNWADSDSISPKPKIDNLLLIKWGLSNKFVVQCAGNMGRAQAIETLFSAAERLLDKPYIHFVFIGSGKKTNWMEKRKKEGKLTNITLIGQRSRDEQGAFLNACDISVATLLPGMTGAGVPSRIYNVMAAGKPVISVADADSEISLIVVEEKIGWVVSPSDPEQLASTILEASSDPCALEKMGKRARQLSETKYSSQTIFAKYDHVIEAMI